ncbi:cytochrome p450 [Phlyctema vagabunda]|uniref:Cytochrome p450 n=1 Tax=Phlyctema vagabunda TaxID=108571 RepID=A0ABR4PET7_9HELO
MEVSKTSYAQWIASFVACYLVYIATLVTYRLTFHPLAKYPGPLLARVSNFYAVYHAYRGDIHLDLERCHGKYGHFVRYRPNGLVVNTADGFHDIYGPSKKIKKADSYEIHGEGNLIGLRDKKHFARFKRIFSQGFSEAALREHEPKVLKQIDTFCEKVLLDESAEGEGKSSGWSSYKNMSEWSNYLTTDIITNVVFTSTWELLHSSANRGILNTISTVLRLTGAGHQTKLIYRYEMSALILPTIHWSIASLRSFTILIMKASMQARQEDPDIKDVFGLFMHAKDPETGKELDFPTVRFNASTLIVAGSDTSSTVLAATFFYLSQHPDAYALVAHEIRSAFPTASASNPVRAGPELNSCRYLRAALNEAMRLTPPVTQPLWREVEDGGALIGGRFIPAGTNVSAGLFSLHHDPQVFPDPYQYDLTRWIGEQDDDESLRERHRHFAPFSTGPRTCLAKNFALLELLLTMANVFVRLDFERAAPGQHPLAALGCGGSNRWGRQREDEFQLESYFTSHVDGPMVRFRRREV